MNARTWGFPLEHGAITLSNLTQWLSHFNVVFLSAAVSYHFQNGTYVVQADLRVHYVSYPELQLFIIIIIIRGPPCTTYPPLLKYDVTTGPHLLRITFLIKILFFHSECYPSWLKCFHVRLLLIWLSDKWNSWIDGDTNRETKANSRGCLCLNTCFILNHSSALSLIGPWAPLITLA